MREHANHSLTSCEYHKQREFGKSIQFPMQHFAFETFLIAAFFTVQSSPAGPGPHVGRGARGQAVAAEGLGRREVDVHQRAHERRRLVRAGR